MFANSGEPRRRLHADFSLLGGLLKELFLHLKKKKSGRNQLVFPRRGRRRGACVSRDVRSRRACAALACPALPGTPGQGAPPGSSRAAAGGSRVPGPGPGQRGDARPRSLRAPGAPRAEGHPAGGAWPWGRGGALGLFSLLRFPQHPLRPSECRAPTLWASPPRPAPSCRYLAGTPGGRARVWRTRWGLGTASRHFGTSFASPSPIPPRPPSLGQAQRSGGREAELVPGWRLRYSGGGAGQGRPGGVGSPAGRGREPAAGRRRSQSWNLQAGVSARCGACVV